MSISSVSSLLANTSVATPKVAAETQNGLLQTTIGQRAIKDKIDLSKDAITLLMGGAQPTQNK